MGGPAFRALRCSLQRRMGTLCMRGMAAPASAKACVAWRPLPRSHLLDDVDTVIENEHQGPAHGRFERTGLHLREDQRGPGPRMRMAFGLTCFDLIPLEEGLECRMGLEDGTRSVVVVGPGHSVQQYFCHWAHTAQMHQAASAPGRHTRQDTHAV